MSLHLIGGPVLMARGRAVSSALNVNSVEVGVVTLDFKGGVLVAGDLTGVDWS